MGFNGSEGSYITLAQGSTMTEDHRIAYPSEPMGVFLGKTKLEALLNQSNAQGLRIYFSQSNGEMNVVVVAADKNENDITTKVLNKAKPSPPYSSTSNPLNS